MLSEQTVSFIFPGDIVNVTPSGSFLTPATAMGAAAASVTDVAELTAALAGALRRQGPTLIDARVDPACYPAVIDLTRGAAGRRLPRA